MKTGFLHGFIGLYFYSPMFLFAYKLVCKIIDFINKVPISDSLGLFPWERNDSLTDQLLFETDRATFLNECIKKSLLELDKFLINGLGLEKGDYVVITGSVPELLVGGTNFIKIHKIGLLSE